MPILGTRQQDAVLAAYRFLDAVNERDADALGGLVTDDVEVRTSDGRAWQGRDGAIAMLDVARERDLRLLPLHRGENAEERGGVVWVELRVRELTPEADIPRVADIVVRDGHIASFAPRPMPFDPGVE